MTVVRREHCCTLHAWHQGCEATHCHKCRLRLDTSAKAFKGRGCLAWQHVAANTPGWLCKCRKGQQQSGC